MRANPTHAILKSGSVHASIIQRRRGMVELPGPLPHLAGAPHHSRRNAALGAGGAGGDHRRRSPRRIPTFTPSSNSGLNRGPFEVPETEPIVATLDRAATKLLGRPPTRRGEPFWTDCAILKDAGIPCVMFGADGAGAHAATEWTTVESVRTLADILTDTAMEFCGDSALRLPLAQAAASVAPASVPGGHRSLKLGEMQLPRIGCPSSSRSDAATTQPISAFAGAILGRTEGAT